jgi:DNA-binding transcriptional ArsR family regulator
MLERLSRGPASASELGRPFDMTLSAVMQHLKVLEAGGLVRSDKIGRLRMCRIEPLALTAAEQWINARRTVWRLHLDQLEAVLAETTQPSDQGNRNHD